MGTWHLKEDLSEGMSLKAEIQMKYKREPHGYV